MRAFRVSKPLCCLGLALALPLSGCAAGNRVLEPVFDEESGETVVRLHRAIVYSRPQPGLSAVGREFVYLGPLETDRMGRISLELWVGLGSTATLGANAAPEFAPKALVLELDGSEAQRLPLEPAPAGAYDVPLPLVGSYLAPVTDQLLAELTAAQHVAVRLEHGYRDRRYQHWHGVWPDWVSRADAFGIGFRVTVNGEM